MSTSFSNSKAHLTYTGNGEGFRRASSSNDSSALEYLGFLMAGAFAVAGADGIADSVVTVVQRIDDGI